VEINNSDKDLLIGGILWVIVYFVE
jgi:hypothetical protein